MVYGVIIRKFLCIYWSVTRHPLILCEGLLFLNLYIGIGLGKFIGSRLGRQFNVSRLFLRWRGLPKSIANLDGGHGRIYSTVLTHVTRILKLICSFSRIELLTGFGFSIKERR